MVDPGLPLQFPFLGSLAAFYLIASLLIEFQRLALAFQAMV